MKLLKHEFVLEKHLDLDGVMCHATHFLSLADEEILCVYFGGTAEKNRDVCIWGARRNKEGKWEKPVRISEDDGIAHWNPVLHRGSDGDVILYYKVGPEIPTWQTMVRTSKDEGKRFGPASELTPGDCGGRGPVRNKIIVLSNGWLLAPASLEEGGWSAFVDISKDDGKSWEMSSMVILEKKSSVPGHRPGIIQPTLWESRPGHVHMLLRSTEGYVYRSDSQDSGLTWGPPYATDLPNNNSGIDLDRLSDGRLVLAYNPVAKNWGPRSPISLAVSEDNGAAWKIVANLETAPGEYSYPALRTQGDQILLTYTWNRQNIAFWQIDFSR